MIAALAPNVAALLVAWLAARQKTRLARWAVDDRDADWWTTLQAKETPK